jgi:succinoglycan biosynthesis protein ExoO
MCFLSLLEERAVLNKNTKPSGIDVSIVIAAWNAEAFISKAIDSALTQQGVSVEVIVVDDASTDNTCKVVNDYSDPRVRLIRSATNGGPGAARNLGFACALGEWVAILDSDDFFLPDRLKTILGYASSSVDILIDNVFEADHLGNISGKFYSISQLPVSRFTLARLIESNSSLFSGERATGYVKPIFRNGFIKSKSIEYWPEIRIGEDYYFFLSCLAEGAVAEVVDCCGYVYTIREGSISRVLVKEDVARMQAADCKMLAKYPLNGAAEVAQLKRSANLSQAYAFLVFVGMLKSRALWPAACQFMRKPYVLLMLWPAIKKRLFANILCG